MIYAQPAVNYQVQLVLEEVKKRNIKNIYFIACGGSLAVMHPNKYFLDREADHVGSDFYNASEFILRNPRTLTDASIVILLSLTGTTPETTEAAVFARNKGALTVGVTCEVESPLAKAVDHVVIYDNAFEGPPIEVIHGNFSVMYQLCAGIIDAVEGKDVLPRLIDNLSKLQPVIDRAKEQYEDIFQTYAKAFKDEKVIYTLASGANYGAAYSHSICNLMELQWIHSHAIHAGEFFHGPFEILDKEVPFILLLGLDETRQLEERALQFLKRFGDKTMILDAKEIDFNNIDAEFRGYLAPIVFNNILWKFVNKIADLRNHPMFTARRYMKKIQY